MRRLLLMLLVLAGLALAACGDDDDEDEGGENARQAECEQVDPPAPKSDGGQEKPRAELDPDRTYIATVTTNCGTFSFQLDVERAPEATASIKALADAGFYEGTTFHRIIPGFVIQGGDPTGTGSGGPGYQTRDEPPADTTYDVGVVAMAKGGPEPPGTAGSQFFVVTGAEGESLTPDYAVVGKISEGQDVVQRIGAFGNANDPAGRATETVVIEDFKVEES